MQLEMAKQQRAMAIQQQAASMQAQAQQYKYPGFFRKVRRYAEVSGRNSLPASICFV